MEKTMLEILKAQAEELLNSSIVREMLANCKNDEERCQMLALASIYALTK